MLWKTNHRSSRIGILGQDVGRWVPFYNGGFFFDQVTCEHTSDQNMWTWRIFHRVRLVQRSQGLCLTWPKSMGHGGLYGKVAVLCLQTARPRHCPGVSLVSVPWITWAQWRKEVEEWCDLVVVSFCLLFSHFSNDLSANERVRNRLWSVYLPRPCFGFHCVDLLLMMCTGWGVSCRKDSPPPIPYQNSKGRNLQTYRSSPCLVLWCLSAWAFHWPLFLLFSRLACLQEEHRSRWISPQWWGYPCRMFGLSFLLLSLLSKEEGAYLDEDYLVSQRGCWKL